MRKKKGESFCTYMEATTLQFFPSFLFYFFLKTLYQYPQILHFFFNVINIYLQFYFLYFIFFILSPSGVLQANQLIQTHIAESLQYRTVLSSPSFLATFLYLQMFGYLIYFGLLFIVLAIPLSQSLFWITLWKYNTIWFPILLIIIVKAVVHKFLLEHIEMDKGQYRGIPHPRLTTFFDMLQMLLSAIVGWAPALVRIIVAFLSTLVLLPRMDLKLPGSKFDGSWIKFRGVMEGWRMQTEYRIVAEHARAARKQRNGGKGRDVSDASDFVDSYLSGKNSGASLFNQENGNVHKSNPSFNMQKYIYVFGVVVKVQRSLQDESL